MTTPVRTPTRPAPSSSAQCAGAQDEATALFLAHAWRWAELDAPPPRWHAALPLAACFDRGLMSRLRLDSDSLPLFAELRLLFASEPVSEVVFDVGVVPADAAPAVRTLLPFPRTVRTTVVRHWSNAQARRTRSSRRCCRPR